MPTGYTDESGFVRYNLVSDGFGGTPCGLGVIDLSRKNIERLKQNILKYLTWICNSVLRTLIRFR